MTHAQRQALGGLTQSPSGLLADEMGMGKTLVVLSYILWYQALVEEERRPYYQATFLLIVPGCLLGSWRRELGKHVWPGQISVMWAHPSMPGGKRIQDLVREDLFGKDLLVVTEEALTAEYKTFIQNQDRSLTEKLKKGKEVADVGDELDQEPETAFARGYSLLYNTGRPWHR